MLSFFLTSWHDQFDAMRRATLRLAAIEKDLTPTTASGWGENYKDELAHFFMDAWHLRDWIRTDKEIPKQTRRTIDAQVRASEVLRIAGHLADRAKHRADPRTGKPASEVGFFSFRVSRPRGERTKTVHINLPSNHVLEADALIAAILATWDEILSAHGLLHEGTNGAPSLPNASL